MFVCNRIRVQIFIAISQGVDITNESLFYKWRTLGTCRQRQTTKLSFRVNMSKARTSQSQWEPQENGQHYNQQLTSLESATALLRRFSAFKVQIF